MIPPSLTAIVKVKMMINKEVVIFSLTRQGVETAVRIKDVLSNKLICTVFAPQKYACEGVFPLKKQLKETIEDVFNRVDAIVAVMATGIIIRMVAPHLKSKMIDPAVVCVDLLGRFVISLLSGHQGGANELTHLIAEGIGGIPIITTASDILEKTSVDELAKFLHCSIKNPESLVKVNSAIVNGEDIVLVRTGEVELPINKFWDHQFTTVDKARQAVKIVNRFDGGIIITEQEIPQEELTTPTTILKPRRITVGIGARKDISEQNIIQTIRFALNEVNIPLERVEGLATVELKKDSLSINNAAKRLGLNLTFLSIDDLRSFDHEDLSPDSKLVKQKIGVGGVCERAALIIAGKETNLILKKTIRNGVTVAIAEGE